ncbi:hypothetical protein HDU86_000743 [Geranomyces michiganensis]|nr:hypothetical protein HDU86_000743 [Geranomyces michiganensis]
MSDPYTALLGTPLSSLAFTSHLEHNHPPEFRQPSSVAAFPGTLFHNYAALGVSYSFDLHNKDPATARFAAIHFYSGLGASGQKYAAYCVPLPLPHGIDIATTTGRDIVLKLGEPTRKTKTPNCCLIYDGDVGLQVDLLCKDWEDPNAKMECLTIWKDVGL